MKTRKKFFILAIIFILAVGAVVGIKMFRGSGGHQHADDAYYCPMHPTYTSDKPGVCPICNMNLVKREDSAQMPQEKSLAKEMENICYLHNCPQVHDGKPCPMLVVAKAGEKITCPICGTHIAGESRAAGGQKKILYWTDPMIPGYKSDKPGKSPMGMDMVPVYSEDTPSGMTEGPDGYAPVLLTPQKQQLIGVKTTVVKSKKLTRVIRTVGTVAHDPELYQAQAEYIQAIQAFKRAQEGNIPEIVDQSRRLVESTRIRLRHMGLSDEMITEIAGWTEAEHSLLFAHPGEPVWVYAKIYEYELPWVQVGQDITAEVPSFGGVVFQGKIRAIDLMVEPQTRTTRLRAQLDDPQGHLKPDMYLNVSLQIDLGESLVIPLEAVFDTGASKIVFVDKGEGLFEPRDVVLGAKAENYYQLKSGVAEGERVVTSGNFLIDSESRLKAALEGFTSPSADEATPTERPAEKPAEKMPESEKVSPGGQPHVH